MKSERSQVRSQLGNQNQRQDGRNFAADRASCYPPPVFEWQLQNSLGHDTLPPVPALFATRLQLELLLQSPVIDLREVTDVILGDLGATLEVLRLAAREREVGEELPARIEDALAGLSLESGLQAVSRAPLAHDGRFAALAAAWKHARAVARSMRAAAECDFLMHPEQAYLVGLLHELHQLPALLGWPGAGAPGESRATGENGFAGPLALRTRPACGSLLAEAWELPAFLIAALREIESGRRSSPWVSLLHKAHGWAETTREAHPIAPPAQPSSRVPTSARKSRVLSFANFEQQQWKTGGAVPPERLPARLPVDSPVGSPMRPPA